MISIHRLRRLRPAAVAALLAWMLAACSQTYPNSTFDHYTDFNRDIDALWDSLLFWGTLVFVLVEAGLVYTIVRFRKREGQAEPKHVHGNTTLEIAWTVIPAIILLVIAIPTVRTIFKTQAQARPDALQVEVIGHQWWWEFRYPQYGVTTANELYLPIGRTVNFSMISKDVIHSFWIPQLGGKRDVMANRKNFLWFTVDSITTSSAWNGTCNEYCGESHANMRFRVFTVQPAEFASWIAHQKSPAAFGATAPPTIPPPTSAPATDTARVATTPLTAAGYAFPREQLPDHTVPKTHLPDGLAFPEHLIGDAARGQQIYSRSSCIGCHTIAGNPMSAGIIGPNLTHVGTRHTIAAGIYPNDTRHMARWIKNAPKMKPGSIMPALGTNERDPKTGRVVTTGGLDYQQIADIVAYLQALK